MQNGFELDLNLCTGCSACAVACAIENELPWGTSWRWVDTFNESHLPELPLYHFSLACNHCADAPCMHHCPALAYDKDEQTGAVLLDPDSCIGCKYCTWACPYDAPRYDKSSGVVSKCTFCQHRQQEGLAPACVTQCPTGALQFGELSTLRGSSEMPGFPRSEAAPSIRFIESRGAPPSAESGGFDLVGMLIPPGPRKEQKISLHTEWPLLVFSLLCAFLVGAMSTLEGREFLGLPGFTVLAGSAALASSFHLGKKTRAWRAVLNWRRSWVSREIILYGLFVGSCALYFLRSGLISGEWLMLVGFGLLFAIDRVYRVLRDVDTVSHSARTLLTGALVAAIFSGSTPILIASVGLKLVLYLRRAWQLHGTDRAIPVLWGVTRVFLGMVLPLSILPLTPAGGTPLIWCAIGVGEIIDRIQFYLELRTTTPRDEIQRMLEPWIRPRKAA